MIHMKSQVLFSLKNNKNNNKIRKLSAINLVETLKVKFLLFSS